MNLSVYTIQTSQPNVSGAPVQLTAGQHAAANVQIANSGQLPGQFQLTADLVQSNGLVGGHMVQAGGSSTTITGTVPAGQSVLVGLVSAGPIADQSQVGPYLDLRLTLTDTSTGETATVDIPKAFLPPLEPSVLTITSVSLGAA